MTTSTSPQQREDLKRVLRMFGRGCTHSGIMSDPKVVSQFMLTHASDYNKFMDSHPGNPASCDECLEIAVKAVLSVITGEHKEEFEPIVDGYATNTGKPA